MKRIKPTLDLRPNWRDPNMLVLVDTKSEGLTPWKPERFQRAVIQRLAMTMEPNWRDDPTYNMRRPK